MIDLERREEFSQLVAQYQSQLFGFIRAMVRRNEDAQDIHQQTLVILWRKFDTYQSGTNFLAWSFRVAEFEIRHFRRRPEAVDGELGDDVLTQLADAMYQQAVRGEQDNRMQALEDCLAKLSSDDRSLIERVYVEDHRITEVAKQMGRLPQSVSNSLRRVRQSLFECIETSVARSEEGR